MKTIIASNLIKGQWVTTDQSFESLNPANNNEIIGKAPLSGFKEVNQAVSAAQDAFEDWHEWSWVKRAEIIDQFAQLLKRDIDELSQLVTLECGKPLNEGKADVIEALHMAQYVAGLGRIGNIGNIISSEIEFKDAYILRKPKGIVACIAPWNFPIAIPLWLTLPSLLAGNTVVLKPSEETPICGYRLAELFKEAGFPDGVINVIHGTGEQAGDPLVNHPDINVILFTGSREIGKYIQQVAAKDKYKFAATEMGGKNAVIILEDADIDIALNSALLSSFKTTGQRCVSAGRLIVDEKIEPLFTKKFIKLAEQISIGDGFKKGVFMGPLINQAGIDKWHKHNEKALEEGAEVLLDGKELSKGEFAYGNFVEPFIYRMPYKPNTFCLKEEAFSPHVAIIPVNGLEEAVKVYNDTDYGLSMAVITEDYRKWRWVRDHAEFGIGYVNLPSIGAEVHLPFGGVKSSGNGHPSAEGVIDSVTHKVGFTVNHAQEIILAQGLGTNIK